MLPGKKYAPEDVLRIVWRRKWLILLPFVVVSMATVLVAWTLPDRYRSDTLILVVPQRVPESYVRSTVTTSIAERLSSISQQILSRTRLERIIQDFGLYPRERRRYTMEDIVDQMKRDIEVQEVRGDAFRVSFVSSDPRTAMRVADRLATAFIDESLTDRTVLAESTSSFLETQLEDARRTLEENERKLAAYKVQHAGELPNERDSNMQAINNLQLQVQQLLDSLNRDRDRRYQLERTIADLSAAPPAGPAITISGDDPTNVLGGSTADQLEKAKMSLRVLELRYTPDHPDVKRMKRVIRDLEAKLQAESLQRPVSGGQARPSTPEEAVRAGRMKEAVAEREMLDRQIAAKQAEEKRLRGVINAYQGRVEATATRETELTSLMRDYDTIRRTYETLLAKKEDSKIAANLERRQIGEQFRTLDPARLPEKPISPNRPLIDLLGAMAGLGLGVGLAAMLEYRDSSFRSDDDVVSVLSLPVVAVIPLMLNSSERRALQRRKILVGAATTVVAVGLVAVAAYLFLWWRF